MRRNRNFLGPQGMGGMVSLWGASSLIRSVQNVRGAVNAATTNFTITAVDPANTIVLYFGLQTSYASTSLGTSMRRSGVLTATNLAVRADNWVGETAGFTVIEFAPGVIKSIQTGVLTVGNVTSNTATITAVNTDKLLLIIQQTNDTSTQAGNICLCEVQVTNSTTLTGYKNTVGGIYASNIGYQAVEFF